MIFAKTQDRWPELRISCFCFFKKYLKRVYFLPKLLEMNLSTMEQCYVKGCSLRGLQVVLPSGSRFASHTSLEFRPVVNTSLFSMITSPQEWHQTKSKPLQEKQTVND
jgi:hypothetical protein